MKQSAGYTILLTVVTAMFRLTSTPHNEDRRATTRAQHSEAAKSSGDAPAKYTHACSALLPAKFGSPIPQDPDRGAAGRMIDDFLHEENLDRSLGSRAASLQIVIALAQDPSTLISA